MAIGRVVRPLEAPGPGMRCGPARRVMPGWCSGRRPCGVFRERGRPRRCAVRPAQEDGVSRGRASGPTVAGRAEDLVEGRSAAGGSGGHAELAGQRARGRVVVEVAPAPSERRAAGGRRWGCSPVSASRRFAPDGGQQPGRQQHQAGSRARARRRSRSAPVIPASKRRSRCSSTAVSAIRAAPVPPGQDCSKPAVVTSARPWRSIVWWARPGQLPSSPVRRSMFAHAKPKDSNRLRARVGAVEDGVSPVRYDVFESEDTARGESGDQVLDDLPRVGHVLHHVAGVDDVERPVRQGVGEQVVGLHGQPRVRGDVLEVDVDGQHLAAAWDVLGQPRGHVTVAGADFQTPSTCRDTGVEEALLAGRVVHLAQRVQPQDSGRFAVVPQVGALEIANMGALLESDRFGSGEVAWSPRRARKGAAGAEGVVSRPPSGPAVAACNTAGARTASGRGPGAGS